MIDCTFSHTPRKKWNILRPASALRDAVVVERRRLCERKDTPVIMALNKVRRLEHARDLSGKIVLVRVDHNCVKRGKVRDAHRIEQSLPTLYNIVERGGRPILMTHVNRPRDGKSGKIVRDDEEDSVKCVVDVLRAKLGVTFAAPSFKSDGDRGIASVDTSVNVLLDDLRARRIGGIYLPNTRWFAGEEAEPGSEEYEAFARQLAGLADVFVNDAFGSWQSHASTVGVTKYLPSYAGLLMQKELNAVEAVLNPVRPFVTVVAGAKVDTKMGTLKAVASRCDTLILGGVVYNAYLCAKYGIEIEGVSERDVELARELLEPETQRKVLELPVVVESTSLNGCGCVPKEGECSMPNATGKTRAIRIDELQRGASYGYFLDVAASSFEDETVKSVLRGAKSIFINAVMGFTSSGFHEGTSALDHAIAENKEARKYFGGGDTIQEFKSLSPALYLAAAYDPTFYLFTGGGTVLKALELGGADKLETVRCIMADDDEKIEPAEEPRCKAFADCAC